MSRIPGHDPVEEGGAGPEVPDYKNRLFHLLPEETGKKDNVQQKEQPVIGDTEKKDRHDGQKHAEALDGQPVVRVSRPKEGFTELTKKKGEID